MGRCECGRTKQARAEACDECAFLDGESAGEAGLIGTLRLLGGAATSYEIAHAWGCTQRTVLRMLRRIRPRGRIYRYIPEANDSGAHDGGAVFVLCDMRETSPWAKMYSGDRMT